MATNALMARYQSLPPSADVAGTPFAYDERNALARWVFPTPRTMEIDDTSMWRQRMGIPSESDEYWATAEGSPWKRTAGQNALLRVNEALNTPTGIVLSNFLGPAVGRIPKPVMAASGTGGGRPGIAASLAHPAGDAAPTPQPSLRSASDQPDQMPLSSAGLPEPASRSSTPRDLSSDASSVLPMDRESRLARAREMGFDTDNVWYHVTDRDFNAFSNRPPSRNTDSEATHIAKLGTWFTDRPELVYNATIDGFEGARTIPVYVKGDMRNEGSVGELLGAAKARGYKKSAVNDGYSGFRMRDEEFSVASPSDAEKQLRLKFDELRAESGRISKEVNDGWRAPGGTYRPELMEKWRAVEAEIESVGNQLSQEKAKRQARSIVVFDPKNIRSVNATFDPAKSESSNLLASYALPAIASGSAAFVSGATNDDPMAAASAGRVPRGGTSRGIRAYHGTNENFTTFDPAMMGSRGKTDEGSFAFSRSPELANAYADGEFRVPPETQRRLYDEHTTPDGRLRLADYNRAMEQAAQQVKAGRVMPVDIDETGFSRVNMAGYDWARDEGARLAGEIAKAKSSGARGIIAENMIDGTGIRDTQVHTWTPGTVYSSTTGERLFSGLPAVAAGGAAFVSGATNDDPMAAASAGRVPRGGGSRSAAGPEFDDRLVEILRKYGIAGLMAGGAAAMAPSGEASQ